MADLSSNRSEATAATGPFHLRVKGASRRRRWPAGRVKVPNPNRAPETTGLHYLTVDDVPALPPSSVARRLRLKLKRLFDLIVALLGLLVLSPIFLGVALAIRATSPGPATFKQRRLGLGGVPIDVYKFRTMYVGAGDATGVRQTVEDDDRITPLGAFLRKTSVDELPQLLNVVLGNMSLVGPRPHAIGMRAGGMPYERLVPYYELRLAMLPGITGWAQCHGLRGPTCDAAEARARIDHDIAYIQNFSLRLDLVILYKTVRYQIVTGY
jgi:lipopolysaccharide/colanic/teichoic acid biosynthesis glycosyltransferase